MLLGPHVSGVISDVHVIERLGELGLVLLLLFPGVGAILDTPFLHANLGTVLSLVTAALVTKTVINALILRR